MCLLVAAQGPEINRGLEEALIVYFQPWNNSMLQNQKSTAQGCLEGNPHFWYVCFTSQGQPINALTRHNDQTKRGRPALGYKWRKGSNHDPYPAPPCHTPDNLTSSPTSGNKEWSSLYWCAPDQDGHTSTWLLCRWHTHKTFPGGFHALVGHFQICGCHKSE